MNKLPATVVTGFLGSGKTTLVQNVLKNTEGLRVAVIVNEFGAMDVDTELVRQCSIGCEDDTASGPGIYELANGCICCTVQEEFHPVLEQLIERRDQIDHILIETSGLALPKPLVQAFAWPEIRTACTVDAVITVVDGPAVAAGRFADDPDAVQAQRLADESLDHAPELVELFDDQLSAADLVLVNKTDLMSDDTLARVSDAITARLPREVKLLPTAQCAVSPSVLLGVGAAAEDAIDHIHTHHDHHHDHDEEHHHAHDVFSHVVLDLPPMAPDALQAGLDAVVASETVFRVKGHAAVPEKPMRLLVQGVGARFDTHYDRRWRDDEARRTRLVCIGFHLDKARLEGYFETQQVA
ncbi:MAG: cobalamin biosynthesis protein CobW [Pseudomonadota bacterium]